MCCTFLQPRQERSQIVPGERRLVLPGVVSMESWAQVAETYPMPTMTRFMLRRFIIPLVMLFPKPAAAVSFFNISAKPVQNAKGQGISEPVSDGSSPEKLICDTFVLASATFFSQ